jgi:ribulose-phosphate 3-epimerase
MVTFHIEAESDPLPLLQKLHTAGRKGGLAIRPGTAVEALLPYVGACDMVLVMTVEPGFGGQSFMVEPLEKIVAIREAGAEDLDVQVDGGITVATLPQALQAGANVFVAGSAVFGGEDVPANVAALKQAMSGGRTVA